VQDASTRGFLSWKGRYRDDINVYESTHRFVDATSCNITTYKNIRQFSCNWLTNDLAAMNEKYTYLVEELKRCRLEGETPSLRVAQNFVGTDTGFSKIMSHESSNFTYSGNWRLQLAVVKAWTYLKKKDTNSYRVTFRLDNDDS
jgi:hypothetical protein